MRNRIEILSDRDHVLRRPAMYVGAMDETEVEDFGITGEGTIAFSSVRYVPALVKIIDEIVANSIDEAIRNGFRKGNLVRVTMTGDAVTVEDNGGGIPVAVEEKTGEHMPVVAWGRAKSGANFNDDDRVTIGLNGVGSFATNVFSRRFVGETCDGSRTLKVTFKDNAETYRVDVRETPGAATFTRVSFIPDLRRFGMETMGDVYRNIVMQKLMNFSVSYPDISFRFNGKAISVRKGKRFLEMFGSEFEHVENDRCLVGVFPNGFDDFKQYSFVNGLRLTNGGNHVDHIMGEIVPAIREKFRKYDLKPGDVKNKLVLVCFLKGFPNAKFDSQTKERLTNGTKEISDFLSGSRLDSLAAAVCRNGAIVDPIIETFRMKEELKERLSINRMNRGGGKVRCDKYIPSIKRNRYFVVAEGLSATNALMPVLGREDFAFFSCRGVPLNAYEVPTKKVLENEELSSMMRILEMKIGEGSAGASISFDNVLLAQDADLDGSKIKGLMVGFFSRYAPGLFAERRIKTLRTPIVVLKHHDRIGKFFFTFDEYNEHVRKRGTDRASIEYKKGLGSWKASDLKALIAEHGIDRFIEDLVPDEGFDRLVDDWLSKDASDVRKEHLRQCNFSIFSI